MKLSKRLLDLAGVLTEGYDENISVGINKFAERHLKKANFTHVPSMKILSEIQSIVEEKMNQGRYEAGYAPFVKIVKLFPEDIDSNSIKSSLAMITDENKGLLKTKQVKRRDFEEPYDASYFDHDSVDKLPFHHIDIVLYTKEQLESEPDGNSTGADYDIISINAEPFEKSSPMTPVTMRRNASGKGGSGHVHSDEEISAAENFWNKHAMVGEP